MSEIFPATKTVSIAVHGEVENDVIATVFEYITFADHEKFRLSQLAPTLFTIISVHKETLGVLPDETFPENKIIELVHGDFYIPSDATVRINRLTSI